MSGSAAVAHGVGAERSRAEAQRYGTIVIVGGGCYGSYYLRQLRRAAGAGALTAEQVLVVDRDAECSVATAEAQRSDGAASDLAVAVVAAEWGDFFDRFLSERAAAGCTGRDAIVPSPLMPHLMYQWLARRAQRRWPERRIETRPLHRAPSVPWERRGEGEERTHYVSFAEWMCPINCIEPAVCPVIRGPRTWSLPPAVRAYVDAERARGRELAGPVLFHCRHRAYGVGMFDVADVLAADALVASAGEGGAVELLVGTVSHCHGALNVLAIGD
ncbi:MAG: hypothetical protein ACREON_10415 [Gemmatimonadaceae bacterium]